MELLEKTKVNLKFISRIYPSGIYILFWFTVILDIGSTLFAMSIPQYQCIESNPLFYILGPIPFFTTYILINCFLFLLTLYYQTRWKQGAIALVVAVLVHGLCGINNLFQIFNAILLL